MEIKDKLIGVSSVVGNDNLYYPEIMDPVFKDSKGTYVYRLASENLQTLLVILDNYNLSNKEIHDEIMQLKMAGESKVQPGTVYNEETELDTTFAKIYVSEDIDLVKTNIVWEDDLDVLPNEPVLGLYIDGITYVGREDYLLKIAFSFIENKEILHDIIFNLCLCFNHYTKYQLLAHQMLSQDISDELKETIKNEIKKFDKYLFAMSRLGLNNDNILGIAGVFNHHEKDTNLPRLMDVVFCGNNSYYMRDNNSRYAIMSDLIANETPDVIVSDVITHINNNESDNKIKRLDGECVVSDDSFMGIAELLDNDLVHMEENIPKDAIIYGIILKNGHVYIGTKEYMLENVVSELLADNTIFGYSTLYNFYMDARLYDEALCLKEYLNNNCPYFSRLIEYIDRAILASKTLDDILLNVDKNNLSRDKVRELVSRK